MLLVLILAQIRGVPSSQLSAAGGRDALVPSQKDFHSYFVADGVLVHNYKDDIKEFRAIAKQEGVDLNAFSDAVHAHKNGLSLPKGAKLSKKKLREIARDVKNGQWF